MSKFWVFLNSVWAEGKKVSWPSKKDLMNSTLMVLVILIFVTIYLMLIEGGLSQLFTKLIYPALGLIK